jgi:hypothetical protein
MRKLLVPIDSGSLSENLKNHLKDFASDMQSEITLFYASGENTRDFSHGLNRALSLGLKS